MKATQPVVEEFVGLHERYLKAHQRMALLQKTAIEGLLHIGIGCVNENSKQEFATLKAEIEETLNGMEEICHRLG